MEERAKACEVAFPSRKDVYGKPLCALCGYFLKGGRRRYCSSKCRDEVYFQCNPGHRRGVVFRRDRGICALCGTDCEKLDRIIGKARHEAHEFNPDYFWTMKNWIFELLGFDIEWVWWEADHIIPLAEGGANTLENHRTLCIPCHKKETAAMHARLASARKRARPLPLLDAAEGS